MIYTLIGLFWFLIVLWASVIDHTNKWNRRKPINHLREWIIRALLLVPSVLLLCLPKITLPELAITIPLEGFMFLLLFDGLYNNKRGYDWWFLGSKDKDDAWWDKQQRKIPLKWLKVLKVGIPLTLLITYILTCR